MTKEFVVFDAEDNEIEWYDPYLNHDIASDGVIDVNNGLGVYLAVIPEGGRYEIRPKVSVTRQELLETICVAGWLSEDEGRAQNIADAVMELLREADDE